MSRTFVTFIPVALCVPMRAYADSSHEVNQRAYSIVLKNKTLSEIAYETLGAYYSIGSEKVNELYLHLNPHLKNANVIREGVKIFHPTKNEIEILKYGKLAGIRDPFDKVFSNIKKKENEVTVFKGDTLSEIIYANHEIKDYKDYLNILDRYLKLNKQITNKNVIEVGSAIAIPKGIPRKHLIRNVASTEAKKDFSEELSTDFFFGMSGFFNTVSGHNKSNGTNSTILSDKGYSFNFGVKGRYKKFEALYSFEHRRVSFQTPDGFALRGSSQSTNRFIFENNFLMSERFKLISKFSYGSRYFQKSFNTSTLEFYNVNSFEYGAGLGVNILTLKKLKIDFEAIYSMSNLSGEQSDNFDTGSLIEGDIKFSFPRSWGEPGFKLIYRREEIESNMYNQEIDEKGVLIFHNLGF